MINDFHISGVNLAERFASVLREEGAHFRLIHRTDPPCVSIYEVLRIP